MALSKCTDRKCSLSGMYDQRRKKKGLAGNYVFVGVCAVVSSSISTLMLDLDERWPSRRPCARQPLPFVLEEITDLFCWLNSWVLSSSWSLKIWNHLCSSVTMLAAKRKQTHDNLEGVSELLQQNIKFIANVVFPIPDLRDLKLSKLNKKRSSFKK